MVLQGAGTGFRNETVHIPLDVANFRLVENPADLVDDVIPNRLLTEVKDQLIPAEDRLLLRMPHRIFRVFPVEVTVGIDHLRLNPDPKFKTEFTHLIGKGLQPTGELFPVDGIITQTGFVVVTLAEPAVIQDKEFDPQILGFLGQLEQLTLVKVKVIGFPAVDQDRPFPLLPGTPDDMFVDKVVHVMAHSVKALVAEGQDRFGGLKTRSAPAATRNSGD